MAVLGLRCYACGLSLVAVSGGYSSLRCVGFSCCRTRALDARASVLVARGLSSCGVQPGLLCGMWDLPGPGIEPASPALAGRFLTTAPPGKSLPSVLMMLCLCSCLKTTNKIFFQAEDGIRDHCVTGVQTCALPISPDAQAQ